MSFTCPSQKQKRVDTNTNYGTGKYRLVRILIIIVTPTRVIVILLCSNDTSKTSLAFMLQRPFQQIVRPIMFNERLDEIMSVLKIVIYCRYVFNLIRTYCTDVCVLHNTCRNPCLNAQSKK